MDEIADRAADVTLQEPELLAKGLKNYDKSLEIPLVADPELKAFKNFRCFDDFEKQPLHGTFLVDGAAAGFAPPVPRA